MAITLIRTWQNGLATSGPALPRYTPWWQSSPATRNVVWVDSNSTAATEDGTEDRPYTQVGTDADGANTTAMSDASVVTAESPVIIVKEGHVETITAASTFAKTGLTIIGLGSGSTKPAFTAGAAGVMWTLSGVRQHVYNCRFPAASTAGSHRLATSADDFLIEDCDFTGGVLDTASASIVSTGHSPGIRGCTFTSSGTVSTRPNSAIYTASGSQVAIRITDCSFYAGVGGWDTPIYIAGSALDFKMRNLTFTGVKSLITIVTGSRGWIAGVTGPGVVEWPI